MQSKSGSSAIPLTEKPETIRHKPQKEDIWIDEFGHRLYICKGGKTVRFLDVKTCALYEQDIESFLKEHKKEDL